MTAAAMDDELFRVLRDDAGMPESVAAKVARLIFRRDRRDDEFVTKAERETDREAARAVREAERKADRDAFAAKEDVTVLQTKATTVEAAIVRIDKSIERIDATLVSMKELLARMDERINGIESQSNKFFYIFFSLHIVTITALVGLLTKGSLWGVAP